MKKILLLPLLLLVGCGGPDFSEKFPPASNLRIAASPSLFVQKSPLRGLDIDVMRAVAKDLDLRPTFKEVAFPDSLAELRQNQWDVAVGAIVPIPERRRNVFFSRPYFERQLLLLERPGPPLVAARLGSRAEIEALEMPGVTVRGTRSSAETIQLLREGSVSLAWISNDRYEKGPWEIKRRVPLGEGYAIGAREEVLADAISASLDRLAASGELERIKKRYLPE